ncbi:MAG TPA: hypothetical protein VLI90_09820, partial [Tepidisphaeraceae bacterium]|nr:hypothetical protein [Tepidisphaeraceae bacterium]
MLRRAPLLSLALLILASSLAHAADNDDIALLKKAADWQIAALPTQKAYKQDTANGWIRAPFYVGVMSLHDALKDDQHYLNAMMDIAEQCHWELANRKYPPGGTTVPSSWSTTQAALDAGILEPGRPFLRHADDLAMGQLYCELYFIKRDPHMIESL